METPIINNADTVNLLALDHVERATCYVCGLHGRMGKELIDTDTIDYTGHVTCKPACRDIETCLNRKYSKLEHGR